MDSEGGDRGMGRVMDRGLGRCSMGVKECWINILYKSILRLKFKLAAIVPFRESEYFRFIIRVVVFHLFESGLRGEHRFFYPVERLCC